MWIEQRDNYIETPELNQRSEILSQTQSDIENLRSSIVYSEYTIRSWDSLWRVIRRHTNNPDLVREVFRMWINNIAVWDVLHFYWNNWAILLTQSWWIHVIWEVSNIDYNNTISSIDTTYTVQRWDNLLNIISRYPISEEVVLDLNRQNPQISPWNVVEVLSLDRIVVYRNAQKDNIIFESNHEVAPIHDYSDYNLVSQEDGYESQQVEDSFESIQDEIADIEIEDTFLPSTPDINTPQPLYDSQDYRVNIDIYPSEEIVSQIDFFEEFLIWDMEFFFNLFQNHIDNFNRQNYSQHYRERILRDVNNFMNLKNRYQDTILSSNIDDAIANNISNILNSVESKTSELLIMYPLPDSEFENYRNYTYEQFMALDKVERFRIVSHPDVRWYRRIRFPNRELQSRVSLNDILPDFYAWASVLRSREIRAWRAPAVANYYGVYRREWDWFVNLFAWVWNNNNRPVIMSDFIIKPYVDLSLAEVDNMIFDRESPFRGDRDAYQNELIIRNLFDWYLDELIQRLPQNTAINRDFIYSVIAQESMFNPNAVSHTWVRWLSQITTTTYLQNLSSMDDSQILRVWSRSRVDTELYDPGNAFQVMVNHFASIERRLFSDIENHNLRKELMIISYNAWENLVNSIYRSNMSSINSWDDFIRVLRSRFSSWQRLSDWRRVVNSNPRHTLTLAKLNEITNHFNKSRNKYITLAWI